MKLLFTLILISATPKLDLEKSKTVELSFIGEPEEYCVCKIEAKGDITKIKCIGANEVKKQETPKPQPMEL